MQPTERRKKLYLHSANTFTEVQWQAAREGCRPSMLAALYN